MKKILALTLAILLVLSTALFSFATPVQGLTATLVSSKTFVLNGETFTVNLNLSNVSSVLGGVGSFQADVRYDTAVLEYVSAAYSANYPAGNFDKSSLTGKVRLLYFDNTAEQNKAISTDEAPLYTLTFKVKDTAAIGQSNITIEGLDASDANAITVSNVTTNNSFIKVFVPATFEGIADGGVYNTDKTVTFTNATATLDGNTLTSGTTISAEGSHTIVVTDLKGDQTTYDFTIDKTNPVITIGNYSTAPRNTDLIVTATTNEGTLNPSSHTFTANDSFTFTVTDAAGNTASQVVTVTNIDKTAPIITLGTYLTTATNQDIIVTAGTNEGTLNATTHTFTANDSFTFTATDAAGNVTNQVVTISNIDKVVPVITIGTYSTAPTNQDITVTATTNEGTLNPSSHTFTANDSFTFTVTDAAGNTASQVVTVTNIDKTAPIITLGTYLTTATNQDIIVTAGTNEGTLNATTHTFTANGSFTFTATDAAGNITSQVVTITNIDKTAPLITVKDDLDVVIDMNGVISSTNKAKVTLSDGTYTVKKDGSAYTVPEDGNITDVGTYEVTATDALGNISTSTFIIAIMSTGGTKTDSATSVKIEYIGNIVPENVELVVVSVPINQINTGSFVMKTGENISAAFDITLLSNGIEIQPNGKIKISLPIPAGDLGKDIRIIHIMDNGTVVELVATIVNGFAVFETDSLREFVILATPKSPISNTADMIVIFIALLIISLFGIALMIAISRKRKA